MAYRGQVALRSRNMKGSAAVEVPGIDYDACFDVAPQQRHIAVKYAGAQLGSSLWSRNIQPVCSIPE